MTVATIINDVLAGRRRRLKCPKCGGTMVMERGAHIVIAECVYCDFREVGTVGADGRFTARDLSEAVDPPKPKRKRGIGHLMKCRVRGCGSPVEAMSLCKYHLAYYHRCEEHDLDAWLQKMNRRPVVVSRRRGPTECIAPGCNRPVKCQGLCGMHYSRWRYLGRPVMDEWIEAGALSLLASRGYDGRCRVPGCDKNHKARGLCRLHWMRWRRLGMPDMGAWIESGAKGRSARGVCAIDGCGEPHKSRGLCLRHYSAWRDCANITPGLKIEHYIALGGPRVSEYRKQYAESS